MKAKYLSFIIFCLCFLGAYPANAADEQIINGHVDKNSIKMVQGQSSNAQNINIKENHGIDLVNNAGNINITNNTNIVTNGSNVNPALQPAKPATHGASIIDKSNKSKKAFALSHQTLRAAWRKKNITSAQSVDRKANIKQSRELQDLETKRKNMKESRKQELKLKPARKILKPNPNWEDNAP